LDVFPPVPSIGLGQIDKQQAEFFFLLFNDYTL